MPTHLSLISWSGYIPSIIIIFFSSCYYFFFLLLSFFLSYIFFSSFFYFCFAFCPFLFFFFLFFFYWFLIRIFWLSDLYIFSLRLSRFLPIPFLFCASSSSSSFLNHSSSVCPLLFHFVPFLAFLHLLFFFYPSLYLSFIYPLSISYFISPPSLFFHYFSSSSYSSLSYPFFLHSFFRTTISFSSHIILQHLNTFISSFLPHLPLLILLNLFLPLFSSSSYSPSSSRLTRVLGIRQ